MYRSLKKVLQIIVVLKMKEFLFPVNYLQIIQKEKRKKKVWRMYFLMTLCKLSYEMRELSFFIEESENILYNLCTQNIIRNKLNNWVIFNQIASLSISLFQLKKSNINMSEAVDMSHRYQRRDLIWIYIDNMYNTENNIKKSIEYMIGSGKIATWNGMGLNEWV